MSQLKLPDSYLEVSVGPQIIFLAYSIMFCIAGFAVVAISVDHRSIWGGIIGLCTFALSMVLLRFFLMNRKWRIDLDDGEMYLIEGISPSSCKSTRKYNLRQFSRAFYALTLNRRSVVYTVTVTDIQGNAVNVATSLIEQDAKKLTEIICMKFGLANAGYIGL